MAHPPRSNPPLRSSSGPPRPCITPSTETFVVVVSFMVAGPFSLVWSSFGTTGPPHRSHRCLTDPDHRVQGPAARSFRRNTVVARPAPSETRSSARGIGDPSAGAAPIPRLGAQCGGELRAPVAQDRVAVGDEHALGTEVEQRLQRRNEAIAVPARSLLAVEVVLPDPQTPACLDHGAAEGER